MTAWMQKTAILVAAGALYLVGQYFRGIWFEHLPSLCLYKESIEGAYCNWPYFDTGLALIAAGEALAIVGVILLFANRAGLRRFFWFSLFYLPLAAITVIWFTPTAPCLVMCGTPAPDYTNMVWNFGYLYILVTIIIILVSLLKARSQRPA